MTTPYLATWNGDTLTVDGSTWDFAPRGKAWRGAAVYVVGPMDWASFARRYFRRGDVVTGPWPGKAKAATLWCRSGVYRIVRADTWGLGPDLDTATATLARRRQAVADEGEAWATTAAGLAGRLSRRILRDCLRQLRPRWRWLAHAAIHSGPMVALRGSLPFATQYDRTQAYLRALDTAVPVPGTWASFREPWDVVSRYDGFVLATVHIDDATAIPPLPVHLHGASIHPTGITTGAWPIHWLRWAERNRDVDVVSVHDAAVCKLAPLCAPLAERFRRVQDDALRKLLYTRAWGRFGSLAWFTATTTGYGVSTCTDGLHWSRDAAGIDRTDCDPDYRPDWAAFVCADNALAMHDIIGRLPPESVALAHVDAVWTGATIDADGWKAKSTGPLRVYGIGTYQHGKRCAAQGYPEWTPLDSQRLDAWAQAGGVSLGTAVSRQWSGSPAYDPNAVSTAPYSDKPLEVIFTPTFGTCWTQNGWVHGEIEMTTTNLRSSQ